MKTFIVEISETLQKQVHIEADSEEDAISKIRNQYKKEDIVLDERTCKYQFEILID